MNDPTPGPRIASSRKAVYYAGLTLGAVGLLLFFSTFVSFALHFGDFDNFAANARSMFLRAVGGMAFMIVGGALAGVGARGVAGSGVVLHPEKTRPHLQPRARTPRRLPHNPFSEMTTRPETHAPPAPPP